MEHEIDNDITLLRKLNIKIDIINNHIQYSLLKTDIYIRGFGKANIDKTINEITDNIEDLYIRRDELKQEIANIECKYHDYYKNKNCRNIYECKYYINNEEQ